MNRTDQGRGPPQTHRVEGTQDLDILGTSSKPCASLITGSLWRRGSRRLVWGLCPCEAPVGDQHRTQKKRKPVSQTGNVGPPPRSVPPPGRGWRSLTAAAKQPAKPRTPARTDPSSSSRPGPWTPARTCRRLRAWGRTETGRGSPRSPRPLITWADPAAAAPGSPLAAPANLHPASRALRPA